VLRTRSPLDALPPKGKNTPFDLHVLSAPPAFVLSQDQTLHHSLQKTLSLPKSFRKSSTQALPTKRTTASFEIHVDVSPEEDPADVTPQNPSPSRPSPQGRQALFAHPPNPNCQSLLHPPPESHDPRGPPSTVPGSTRIPPTPHQPPNLPHPSIPRQGKIRGCCSPSSSLALSRGGYNNNVSSRTRQGCKCEVDAAAANAIFSCSFARSDVAVGYGLPPW
jgi:hypothetical protein